MGRQIKWSRTLESHPQVGQLQALFDTNLNPLWDRGTVLVPTVSLNSELEKVIYSVKGLHQVERGLENIARVLEGEKKGLQARQKLESKEVTQRISRLLLIFDEASERFYRNCERLLTDHSERLIGIKIENASQLIQKLYGEDALTKVLLLSHKAAVERALLALIRPA